VIVPSAMDSPICGITTSVAMIAPIQFWILNDRLNAALVRHSTLEAHKCAF
jgi:hypothetical protein